jgi:glycosyltransferase involved in cell wall biosynthesis
MTSTSGTPRVSVLVTTYNQARYVEEALNSLRDQTSRDFEVIITDDASSDGTGDIIEAWLGRSGYSAQFIRNPENSGICANRNAALALSSGTFVCFLSGDDRFESTRIERQLEFFLAQPAQIAAVYSDMLVVDAEGRPNARSYLNAALDGMPPPQGEVFFRLLAKNFLPGPAVMIRRSAIAAVGGYDESLFYEDFDMWLRLSFRFHFAYLPGLLVRYRMHENSMWHRNRLLMYRCRSQVLAKWLNADLDGNVRQIVLHRLLRNGVAQLLAKDCTGARETFNNILIADRRLVPRLLAQLGMLRGAGTLARALLPFYRCYRRSFKKPLLRASRAVE